MELMRNRCKRRLMAYASALVSSSGTPLGVYGGGAELEDIFEETAV
jgi:hypothetical protein